MRPRVDPFLIVQVWNLSVLFFAIWHGHSNNFCFYGLQAATSQSGHSNLCFYAVQDCRLPALKSLKSLQKPPKASKLPKRCAAALRSHSHAGTCACKLQQALRRNLPETCGTFQNPPESSGTLRNSPEPAPATRTSTHRSLPRTPLAFAAGEKRERHKIQRDRDKNCKIAPKEIVKKHGRETC